MGRIIATVVVLVTAGAGVGAATHGGAEAATDHAVATATTVPPAHLQRRFAVSVGDGASNTSPAVGNGAVFVSACNAGACSLTRRRATDGSVVWRAAVSAGVSSPQLTTGSVVIATSAGIAAYDIATGHRQWSRATASPVTQLAVDPRRVFAAETSGQDITYPASIEVFALADGHRLWSKAQGTWQSDQLLAVAGGIVYANHSVVQSYLGVDEYAAGSGQSIRRVAKCHVGVFANGLLYDGARACNPVTGAIVWSDAAAAGAANPAVNSAQLDLPIATGNGNPAVRAFDAHTGQRLWTHALQPNGSSNNAPPTIAGGVVYAATASYPPATAYRRTLTALRQSDGFVLATVTVPGSAGPQIAPHVSVANGVVYLQAAGVLYGYSA